MEEIYMNRTKGYKEVTIEVFDNCDNFLYIRKFRLHPYDSSHKSYSFMYAMIHTTEEMGNNVKVLTRPKFES